ncbi:MAG: four helix bundle protein [Chloroflexi bacterium]|nr:MAG: four helix bundle protein [Chloroflexota bacterium]
MGRIERFEDIQAWKKARYLTRKIYSVTGDSRFSRDFGLRDQLRRAATSIMLNIAEGYARKTGKEFVRYLYIARASAAEVQSALYVAIDQAYITEEEFNALYHEAEEVSKMITGFIKYLEHLNT